MVEATPEQAPMQNLLAHAVAPPPDVDAQLTGATFIDAYGVLTPACLTAEQAGRIMMENPPPWIGALLALRNAVVTPLGLKTGPDAGDAREWIGIFPVESKTTNRMVLGFDDKHLDFRVVVDVAPSDAGSAVTVTTLVREHNVLGRTYLRTIMPFHRAIVKALVGRVGRRAS